MTTFQIGGREFKIPRISLQQGRFPHSRDPFSSSPQGNAENIETVYEIFNLPDGFKAVFDHGTFNHGDVSDIADFYRETYSGKELRLVPLSELDGEVSYYNKSTGVSTPFTSPEAVYVLLVEDKEVPNGDLAKSIHFAMQGLKGKAFPTEENASLT